MGNNASTLCIQNDVTQDIGQRDVNKYAERKGVLHSYKVSKYAGFSKINLCDFEDFIICFYVYVLMGRTKCAAFPKLI